MALQLVWLVLLTLMQTSLAWAAIPSGIGWYEIPNTTQQTVFYCTANNTPTGCSTIYGTNGPAAIQDAWGGGVWDSNEDRLLLFGGGHGDYGGNDIYALKLYDANNLMNPSMVRLTNPVTTGCVGSSGINGDGSPCGRHMYDNMTYNPLRHLMVLKGGSLFPNAGSDHITFTRNLRPSGTWANLGSGGCQSDSSPGDNIEYDAELDMYFCHATFNFYSAPASSTLTWSNRGSDGAPPGNIDSKYSFIDTKRHQYVSFTPGYTQISRWPLTASGTITVSKAALPVGCSGFYSASGDFQNAGIDYDSYQDRYVLWDGGQTVQILDPNTLTCTTTTPSMLSGTAPPSTTVMNARNGTYGRFRYVPHHNLFVLCISADRNCYTLRLTANDFSARAAGNGVIGSESFDGTSLFATCTTSNISGLHPSDAGNCSRMARDTSTIFEGASALRMTHPAGVASSNATGEYWNIWPQCPAGPQRCHFYIQFAMRISPEYITNLSQWRANTTQAAAWKTHIIGRGLGSGGATPGTCGPIEITTVLWNFEFGSNREIQAYGNCGSLHFNTDSTNYTFTSSGTTYRQSTAATGARGYSCQTSSPASGSGNGANCFNFADAANQNQWITFYYDIYVGTWGAANSILKAYISKDGGPYLQWLNVSGVSLDFGATGAGDGYGLSVLTPYMTNLNVAASSDARMWFDSYIVSYAPIAAPDGTGSGTPPDTTPPSAPTGIFISKAGN